MAEMAKDIKCFISNSTAKGDWRPGVGINPKPLGIGLVTDSINQDRYWNGSYDISPPPPDYAIADF